MSGRISVALIAPNYHPVTCGIGDNTMRLGAELRRRGHRAVVFTHQPAQAHPEAPDLPVRGVHGTTPLAIAAAVSDAITADEFSHVIIQYAPQMWGASRFGSPGLPSLAAGLRERGISVVLIIHELYTPWKWRPDLALGSLLLRLQLGALMSSCSSIYLTTETRQRTLARAAAQLSPPRTLKSLRIGPGALPHRAQRKAGGHRMGLFSTLAVGKAFDVVLDAFDEIAAVYADAELLLIGDLGQPGDRRFLALSRQIEARRARTRVHLTGKLPLDEVARIVASLDLYLFPMSTGANTRSSTLPLALGAGVPVVAIHGTETDPIFRHGRDVFFADSLSGPAFARAALEVFAAPALADRLAHGARELYEEHLTWTRIGDSLLADLA